MRGRPPSRRTASHTGAWWLCCAMLCYAVLCCALLCRCDAMLWRCDARATACEPGSVLCGSTRGGTCTRKVDPSEKGASMPGRCVHMKKVGARRHRGVAVDGGEHAQRRREEEGARGHLTHTEPRSERLSISEALLTGHLYSRAEVTCWPSIGTTDGASSASCTCEGGGTHSNT